MRIQRGMWWLLLGVWATVACKKGDDPLDPAEDMSIALDLANFRSNCGWPGDKGNALGVGRFCLNLDDCAENPKAILCTTLGDRENFFCTFRCSMGGPADQCGADASCQCSTGGCGCMPNKCLGTPEDGGVDAKDMTTKD